MCYCVTTDTNIKPSVNPWTNVSSLSGHFTPEPDPDNDIGSLQSKYSLDRRREDEKESSPPKSPPPFSKAESRFEREQRIKVGSLDSYTPGNTLPRQKRYHHCPWLQEDDHACVIPSISPPPAQSGAQQNYERERFRVEPGRIENYTIGKGTLAQQESYKVRKIVLICLKSLIFEKKEEIFS